jgi:hypothetical protein
MALTTAALQSTQLIEGRLGYMAVAFDAFSGTGVDQLTAGSAFECASTVYYASALESIDSTATLAGLGAGTWVYVYFNPATSQLYCSGSAPAFSTSKIGWYLAASPTHRCIYIFYKVGAGNYTNKTIPVTQGYGIRVDGLSCTIGANADRTLTFASDASIMWDESEDAFVINKDFNYLKAKYGRKITGQWTVAGIMKTQNDFFDTLSPYVPITGDWILFHGIIYYSGAPYTALSLKRISSTEININVAYSDGTLTTLRGQDGLATNIADTFTFYW